MHATAKQHQHAHGSHPTHRKSETLTDIISIGSPAKARVAVQRLEAWAVGDPDRARQANRAATLAANRAEHSLKGHARPLGPREKKQMEEVAHIYRSFIAS